jgi:hypothetical protein
VQSLKIIAMISAISPTRAVFIMDVRSLGLEVHLSCLLRGGHRVLDPLF